VENCQNDVFEVLISYNSRQKICQFYAKKWCCYDAPFSCIICASLFMSADYVENTKTITENWLILHEVDWLYWNYIVGYKSRISTAT